MTYSEGHTQEVAMDKRKHADHYHIHVGLPGCLPNTSFSCETLAEAGNIAYEEAEAFRDAGFHRNYGHDQRGIVTGNKHDGYEVLRSSLWEYKERTTWQTITIHHCNDAECRCPECATLFCCGDGVCPECNFSY